MLKTLLFLFLLAAPLWAEPRFHVLRLKPGDDLRQQLIDYVKERHIQAASLVTCVGSLREAHLRLAGRPDVLSLQGPLEIVSLVGTIAESGLHLHMSVADGGGVVHGGHLVEVDPVYTTAEIVLVELPGLQFTREQDPSTGFPELRVKPLGGETP